MINEDKSSIVTGPYELMQITVDELACTFPAPMLVYIAGPYRSVGEEAVCENVDHAKRVAIACTRAGVYYYCPHMNTEGFSGDRVPDGERGHRGVIKGESFFLEMDKVILKRFDAILMTSIVPGDWKKSGGAVGELKQALDDGLLCCELVGEL